jgi:hypothetical protein
MHHCEDSHIERVVKMHECMYLCDTIEFLQRRPKHVRLHGRARGGEALRVRSVLQPREHGLHARRELRGQTGSVRRARARARARARVGGGETLQHIGDHLARKLLHVRRLGDGGSRGSDRRSCRDGRGDRFKRKETRSRAESTCQRECATNETRHAIRKRV